VLVNDLHAKGNYDMAKQYQMLNNIPMALIETSNRETRNATDDKITFKYGAK
jgi:hypothetical protein